MKIDTNGILLGIHELSILVQHTDSKKLLEKLLNAGKEIKVITKYKILKSPKEILNDTKEQLERELKSEEFGMLDLAEKAGTVAFLMELEEEEGEENFITMISNSEEYKYKEKFIPEVFVFRKPYHEIDHIIKWLHSYNYLSTDETFYRYKPVKQYPISYENLYKKLKKLCEHFGI